MWVGGPKRRRDFQGLCSAAGKCSGFGGFRQSCSRPSLLPLLWGGARFWQGKHTWQAAAPREMGPSVLGWGLGTCRSKGSARAVLQLAQGRRKNSPDIARLPPTASVFFLFCPKKHSRQALAIQALVIPCLQALLLLQCRGVNQKGVNQSEVIPLWQRSRAVSRLSSWFLPGVGDGQGWQLHVCCPAREGRAAAALL